jgi:hypothetical protein
MDFNLQKGSHFLQPNENKRMSGGARDAQPGLAPTVGAYSVGSKNGRWKRANNTILSITEQPVGSGFGIDGSSVPQEKKDTFFELQNHQEQPVGLGASWYPDMYMLIIGRWSPEWNGTDVEGTGTATNLKWCYLRPVTASDGVPITKTDNTGRIFYNGIWEPIKAANLYIKWDPLSTQGVPIKNEGSMGWPYPVWASGADSLSRLSSFTNKQAAQPISRFVLPGYVMSARIMYLIRTGLWDANNGAINSESRGFIDPHPNWNKKNPRIFQAPAQPEWKTQLDPSALSSLASKTRLKTFNVPDFTVSPWGLSSRYPNFGDKIEISTTESNGGAIGTPSWPNSAVPALYMNTTNVDNFSMPIDYHLNLLYQEGCSGAAVNAMKKLQGFPNAVVNSKVDLPVITSTGANTGKTVTVFNKPFSELTSTGGILKTLPNPRIGYFKERGNIIDDLNTQVKTANTNEPEDFWTQCTINGTDQVKGKCSWNNLAWQYTGPPVPNPGYTWPDDGPQPPPGVPNSLDPVTGLAYIKYAIFDAVGGIGPTQHPTWNWLRVSRVAGSIVYTLDKTPSNITGNNIDFALNAYKPGMSIRVTNDLWYPDIVPSKYIRVASPNCFAKDFHDRDATGLVPSTQAGYILNQAMAKYICDVWRYFGTSGPAGIPSLVILGPDLGKPYNPWPDGQVGRVTISAWKGNIVGFEDNNGDYTKPCKGHWEFELLKCQNKTNENGHELYAPWQFSDPDKPKKPGTNLPYPLPLPRLKLNQQRPSRELEWQNYPSWSETYSCDGFFDKTDTPFLPLYEGPVFGSDQSTIEKQLKVQLSAALNRHVLPAKDAAGNITPGAMPPNVGNTSSNPRAVCNADFHYQEDDVKYGMNVYSKILHDNARDAHIYCRMSTDGVFRNIAQSTKAVYGFPYDDSCDNSTLLSERIPPNVINQPEGGLHSVTLEFPKWSEPTL